MHRLSSISVCGIADVIAALNVRLNWSRDARACIRAALASFDSTTLPTKVSIPSYLDSLVSDLFIRSFHTLVIEMANLRNCWSKQLQLLTLYRWTAPGCIASHIMPIQEEPMIPSGTRQAAALRKRTKGSEAQELSSQFDL